MRRQIEKTALDGLLIEVKQDEVEKVVKKIKENIADIEKLIDEIAAHIRDFSHELAAKELAIKTYIC